MNKSKGFLKVGEDVAKAILEIWLADHKIAARAGTSIFDLIQQKVQDVFVAKKADIDMQSLSIIAAKHLEDAAAFEWRYHDQGGIELVISLVSATIEDNILDEQIVESHGYEPKSLANFYLKHRVPLAQDLDQREEELFRVLIHEAAELIVGMVTKNPDFNTKILLSLYQQGRSLERSFQEILENLKKILEKSSDAGTQAGKFEQDYRKDVGFRLDRIQLFGAEEVKSRSYQLSTAYISLSLEVEEDSEEDLESYAVEQLLSKVQPVLIVGEPGSGKTTLLQWLAVQAARFQFIRELSDWNGLVPFYIRLRDYSDGKFPGPELFPFGASNFAAGKMPPGWSHRVLEQGRGLLLIDGLDEIPERSLVEFSNWFSQLSRWYPESKLILTSRPGGSFYALLDQGLRHARLKEMSNKDVQKFIDHWFKAVFLDAPSQEQAKLLKLAESLKKALNENRDLRKLVTNPLLCAMSCALYRMRQRDLPSDRIELYNACKNMFYNRDTDRRIKRKQLPELKTKQKDSLLGHVAAEMTKQDKIKISQQEAISHLQDRLPGMDLEDKVSAKEILGFFVERIGLLREPAHQLIDFPHKTFQEYFTAMELVKKRDIKQILGYTFSWREVVVLAAGQAESHEVSILIESLILNASEFEGASKPRDLQLYEKFTGRKYIESRRYLILLAAHCLNMANEVVPEIRRMVNEVLPSVIQPKTMKEAIELASVGDLVLPYLRYRSDMSLKEALPKIRTLIMIDTPEAYVYLKAYLSDNRTRIQKACLMGIKLSQNTSEYIQTLFGTEGLKGRDLSEMDFRKLDLSGLNLEACNLEKANLEQARLIGANLCGANLSYANFYLSNLENANLEGANLSNASLRNTNLFGANMMNVDIYQTWFYSVYSSDKIVVENKASLIIGLNESKLQSAIGRDLSNANLSYFRLSKFSLRNSKLENALFRNADMSDADLRGANCKNADFSGASLKNIKIDKYTQLDSKWQLLSHIQTLGAVGMNLQRADLSCARLIAINFQEANLSETKLRNADLSYANLSYTNLQGADLRGAELIGTNIDFADLRGASLLGCTFESTSLSKCLIDETTKINEDALKLYSSLKKYLSKYEPKSLVFEDLEFSRNVLDKLIVQNRKRSTFLLKSSKIKNCLFGDLYLSSFSFEDSCVSKTFFEETNLTHCKFKNTNMKKVIFIDVSLEKAVFENARIQDSSLVESRLKEAEITNTKIRNSQLNGAYLQARIKETSFEDSDLTGAYFGSAQLTDVSFENTNLSGVDLLEVEHQWLNLCGAMIDSETKLTPQLQAAWLIANEQWDNRRIDFGLHYFYFKNCNLEKKEFVNIEFENISFESSNLDHAKLIECIFYGVNFTNASLRGTDLSGSSFQEINLKGTLIDSKTKASEEFYHLWKLQNEPEAGKDYSSFIRGGLHLVGLSSHGIKIQDRDLYYSRFNHCNMHDFSFAGSDLSEGSITDTDLSETNLSKAKLVCSYLKDTVLNLTNLASADLTSAEISNTQFIKANLYRANFTNADLQKVDFSGADLTEVNFTGTRFSECTFDESTKLSTDHLAFFELSPQIHLVNHDSGKALQDNSNALNLRDIDFSGLDLSEIDLSLLDLRNTNLTGAKLTETDLRGTDLSNAVLDFVNFKGCLIDEETLLGYGYLQVWLFQNGKLEDNEFLKLGLKNINFRKRFFSGSSFSHLNLSHSDFEDSKFVEIDFNGTDFEGSNLKGCKFVDIKDWQGANFKGADLTDVYEAPEGFIAFARAQGAICDEEEEFEVDFEIVEGETPPRSLTFQAFLELHYPEDLGSD